MQTAEWQSRLKERDVRTRLRTVQEIAATKDPAHIPLLLRCLNDRSNFVVAAAAKGLGACPHSQAITPLVRCYWSLAKKGPTKDRTCAARIEIIPALVACEAMEASEVYFHAIKAVQIEPSGMGTEDVAVPLRMEAASALATFRPAGALLAISLLLFDPTAPLARMAAAKALGHLGDPGAVAVLGVRLARPENEDAEVLISCMDALVELDPEAACELILPYLHKTDPYLIAGAATALATLGPPYQTRVLAILEAAYDQAALPDAQEAIILAIASMRSDAATGTLDRLAEQRGESVRDVLRKAGLRP